MFPWDFFVIPDLIGDILYYQGHQLPHQLPLPDPLPEPLPEPLSEPLPDDDPL